MKAPKGAIGQRSGQRTEAGSSWYTPLLAAYYGNRNVVTVVAIGIILIIAGIFGYNYIQGERGRQAQELLGAVILEYERGEYQVALDGNGDILGLLDIINNYASTPAGNTARFYAGNAFFELDDYEQALEQFENFNASDDFLGASATAGRAAIHEIQGDFARAADLFIRAAEIDDNEVQSPHYLRSAVRAYVESGEFESAEEVILEAKERYPETDLIDEFNYMLGVVLAHK